MKRYVFILLSFSVLLFTACEDVIQVELDEQDLGLFAVEAKITTEDNPYVHLYKGLNVDNDGAYPGVSGATVVISDDVLPSNAIQLTEDPDQEGFYRVPENQNYPGVAGREYTVTIEYEDITITGKDMLNSVEPTDSIRVRASLRGDRRFLGIFTYGNEPPGIGNYYKWDIYINDTLLNDAGYMIFASDELVDGNYIDGFEIFTDFHNPDEPEERKLKYLDKVYVKQTSISEQVYLYYYQMLEQSGTGGLFSVPPANIKGNLTASNGKTVLGVFTAHDVSASNVVEIDDSIENQLDER